MANRYNFASVAGTIGDSLHDAMIERERQRQVAVAEQRAAEELRLRQEQDKRAAAQAKSQEETAVLNRTTAADTLARNQRGDVTKRLGEVGMGGEVSGDLLEQAKKLAPETLKVTESHTQNTLPAFSVDPNSGARTQVSQETPFTVADKTTFAGSREERTNHTLADKMGVAKTRQEAAKIALDAGVPSNQVDDIVNTIFKPKGNVWWQTRTGELKLVGPDGKPTAPPAGVTYDKATDSIEKEPAPPGAGGGAPFFVPIAGANGTVPFNGRTGFHLDSNGQWSQSAIPLRPTGAQQQDMVNNASAMTQIELIKGDFNPDWVGPAAGRIGSMYTAFVDDAPGLSRMQTRVSALKNRVIKAITGAQMSEPEATRIMKELPDMNLPPTAFMERLGVAEQNINTLMELQQQVYTGQRRATGEPITEEQLNKLFPDVAPKGTTKTPAAPTTPKAKTSKYHVTVG